jgi:hypothetical protein
MTPTKTTKVEGRTLAVGRSFAAFGGLLLPFLLLAIIFVIPTKNLVNPTLIACAVIVIGCIPDFIAKRRSRKVPACTSTDLRNFVVVDEETPEHVRRSSDEPKLKMANAPPARCFVAYVVFVFSLVITAVVMMYR